MKQVEVRLGHAANCSALGNVLNVLLWSQVIAAGAWAAAEAWQTRRRRAEPGGGESRLTDDPSALVRSTGDGPAGPAGPREAHLQITKVCGLPCAHCHVDTGGGHVPAEVLERRLDDLAARGVLRVAFGGGEPLRHPDVARVAEHARGLGLAVGVTTSGVGPDAELSSFDQVNVSLDGLGEGFRATRGYDGADAALERVRAYAAAGRRVGVNLVLDRLLFEGVEETVAAAVLAGATDVQLLRLKPVGRALQHYADRKLTAAQALAVWPLARRLVERFPGVTIRLDCASMPFLAAHDLDADRMTAFGFRGCHGAVDLVSVDTSGRDNPCSFAPVRPGEDWAKGVVAQPCADCSYQPICKGGCHAVADALTGDRFAPDPECPRVIAYAEAGA